MPTADIPILGHPKIGDWFIGFTLTCVCGATFIVTGQIGAIRGCPGCPKIYRIGGYPTFRPETNAISVVLGIGMRDAGGAERGVV